MSGKLKLLPHKQWNVWNRDNREKVLRDKRLLQEENDIKEKREKELQQEHILSVLKSTAYGSNNNDNKQELIQFNNNNNNNNNNNQNENEKQLVTFRLFDDIEEKLKKQQENEDFKKEKEMKELLKQRKEGTAPWGLADGSHEKSKIKPWYINNQLKNNISLEKDVDDKYRLDPMAKFIIRDEFEYDYHIQQQINNNNNNNNNNNQKIGIPIISNINNIMGLKEIINNDKEKKHKKRDRDSDDDDNDNNSNSKQHKHKHKKHKKEKKHKKHNSDHKK